MNQRAFNMVSTAVRMVGGSTTIIAAANLDVAWPVICGMILGWFWIELWEIRWRMINDAATHIGTSKRVILRDLDSIRVGVMDDLASIRNELDEIRRQVDAEIARRN